MPRDVTMTLRQALAELQTQRQRIDQQIEALQTVLGAGGRRGAGGRGGPGRRARRLGGMRRGRRPMSAAARKAVSQRMKAYWAKRRASSAKGKTAK